MKTSDLCQFMRLHRWAVQATVSPDGSPEAAVIGIAVTDALEVVFDTVTTTRKVENLRRHPKIAFVIGGLGGEERTVQYEGVVDEPHGADLERLKAQYFEAFPDGRARQSWPGLIYIRARPTWIRYSDFSRQPPTVVEFSEKDLAIR